jgi:hypothetical protein
MELVASDTAPFLLYGRNFLSAEEAQGLVEFLASVPERRIEETDPASEFVFVEYQERSGGPSRAEAAAGDPVWLGTDWGQGVAISPELRFLQRRVGDLAGDCDLGRLLGFIPSVSFTSTYVDRYLPGGGFIPHTDGTHYGSVIAGVSVGPGSAKFALWPDDQVERPPVVELSLEPNSVYVFCGPIRHHPWHHAVRDVTDLRYGITWRTAPEPDAKQ